MQIAVRSILHGIAFIVLLGTPLAGALADDMLGNGENVGFSVATPALTDLAFAATAQETSSLSATDTDKRTEGPSLAERIGRLQQSIKNDQERLATLEAKVREQDAEFESASTEFQQRDEEFEKHQQLLRTAENDSNAIQATAIRETMGKTEAKRTLARERFDLAIEAKKTSHEQLVELKAKLEQDRQTLERLLNPPAETASDRVADDSPTSLDPTASADAHEVQGTAKATDPAVQNDPPTTKGPAAAGGTGEDSASADETAQDEEMPRDEEVEKVQQQVAQAEAAKEEAEKEAVAVGQRLEALDRNIALEQKARESARKQGTNAEERIDALEEELQQALNDRVDRGTIDKIRDQISEAQRRIRESRAEVKERAARLDTLQSERADLLREQVAALQEVERANQEALLAKESLEAIQNPFALRNVIKWLVERGPKLLVIVIAALVIHVLVNLLTGRIVNFLAGKETHGRKKDRERRANTLVGVFHSSSILINYAGATLAVLDVAGLPIAPLLGGAAVAGLAVAFAAQNLIKDYFCGFIILLEDQYSVNDVIRIGDITGLVERVTLRVTVVRDLEAVHFIPHGQISSVSNLTHKWSRAVFEIGVAYGENVDDVMDVIVALGKEIREDSVFGPMILDDMEMLGLEAFGDSAVVIKFFIKTRPLKQWAVRRELNRRIKNKFDEVGIEIPFPHRTVYHRVEGNQSIHPLEALGNNRDAEAA